MLAKTLERQLVLRVSQLPPAWPRAFAAPSVMLFQVAPLSVVFHIPPPTVPM